MLPAFLKMFEVLLPDFGSMTGGLDIIAMIMNRYLHMELGKAMSLAGMCIVLSSALVFDKKTVVLRVLGTYFNVSLVV